MDENELRHFLPGQQQELEPIQTGIFLLYPTWFFVTKQQLKKPTTCTIKEVLLFLNSA